MAGAILNNNEERQARLGRLREALERASGRAVPSRTDCVIALLTAEERRHLDLISRTLRITETRQWLARQTERIRQTLRKHIPLLGILPGSPNDVMEEPPAEGADRQTIGWEVFRSRCLRQLDEIDAATIESDFWTEVRRWTKGEDEHGSQSRATRRAVEPPRSPHDLIERRRDAVRTVVGGLDEAIRTWTAKVEEECRGASPRLLGALGAGTLAVAIVLIAATGPITALTLPIITAKLTGALGALAASLGAGAVAGPSLGRFLAIVREKLVGSPEFAGVQAAVEEYRALIEACGQDATALSSAAAQAMVLPEHDELRKALSTLSDAAEVD